MVARAFATNSLTAVIHPGKNMTEIETNTGYQRWQQGNASGDVSCSLSLFKKVFTKFISHVQHFILLMSFKKNIHAKSLHYWHGPEYGEDKSVGRRYPSSHFGIFCITELLLPQMACLFSWHCYVLIQANLLTLTSIQRAILNMCKRRLCGHSLDKQERKGAMVYSEIL